MVFSLFQADVLGKEENVDWKYESLANVTKLQNLAEGTWDYGLNKEFVTLESWGKRVMSDAEREFLSDRKSVFENKFEGLAIYLMSFEYSSVEKIWSRMAKRKKRLAKITFTVFEQGESKKIAVSFDVLFRLAKEQQSSEGIPE